MSIAITSITFRDQPELNSGVINAIEGCDVNGLEVWAGHLRRSGSARALARLFRHTSITVCSISAYLDILGLGRGEQDALQSLEKILMDCSTLNAPGFRVFVGGQGSEYFDVQSLEILEAGLEVLMRNASRYNLQVYAELHFDTYLDSVNSAEKFFRRYAPSIKCLLDLSNLAEEDDDWLTITQRLKEYTGHIHVKNTFSKESLSVSNPFRHVFDANRNLMLPRLQEGCIDYSVVAQELAEVDFQGWWVLEWFGSVDIELLNEEIKTLRALVT